MELYLPLAFLLGIAVVAAALSERSRRAAPVGYGEQPAGGRHIGPALAMARVEAGRLPRHPLTWAGLAGTVAVVVANWDSPMSGARWIVLGYGLYPLLGALVVASHLAVSRDRRAGTAELAATMPVGSGGRTLGHLATAAAVAVAIAAGWLSLMYVWLGGSWSAPLEGSGWSDVWRPAPVELAQPLVAAAVLLAIAVGAGRWWTHPVASFLVPVVLLFSPFMWAVPLIREGGPYGHWQTGAYLGEVTTTHLSWHLLFLVGVLTIAVSGALLRDDRRPALTTAAAIGVVAIVVGYGPSAGSVPG